MMRRHIYVRVLLLCGLLYVCHASFLLSLAETTPSTSGNIQTLDRQTLSVTPTDAQQSTNSVDSKSMSLSSSSSSSPSSSVKSPRIPFIDIHLSLSFHRPAENDLDIHAFGGVHPPPGVYRPGPSPFDPGDNTVTFWPYFFAKFISASYLVLCVLSWVQLLRTIIHRHKIKSFRFGFLLVCFLWTLLRVIFWFLVELHSWPTWLSDLIYFLPNACQIGTFSLLILFYAKLVHRHRWRFLRLRFLGFCILSNTAMVFLTLTFSILMDRVQRTEHDDPTSADAQRVKEFVYKMYFISSAVFFGVLVVLAAFYIHKLRQIDFRVLFTCFGGMFGSCKNALVRGCNACCFTSRSDSSNANDGNNASSNNPTSSRLTAGTSKQEVLVTSLIFLIFLSRCIWDLLAAFDSESTLFRHQIWETDTDHVKLMNLATFLLLFVWEISPTLMVIVYFRNIPNTSDSYCVGLWTCVKPETCFYDCLRTWPCFAFPAEYFLPTEEQDSNGADGSPSMSNGESIIMQGHEESRSDVSNAEYSSMADDGPEPLPSGSTASSVILPPGSFVRSSSVSQNYARSYSSNNGAHLAGMQIGSIKTGSVVHTDLYGSPTWLNPTHPALTHLATGNAANPNGGGAIGTSLQLHQALLAGGGAGGVGVGLTPYGNATQHYYDKDEEDDYAHYANAVHPFVSQQQQAAAAAQQSHRGSIIARPQPNTSDAHEHDAPY